MSEPKVTETKIAELIPDAANANRGTERGSAMLESSLRQYGAARSIVVDKEGRVISGNKTLEQAGQIGLEDVIVVQTDGKKLVAVQRTDLDLADGGMARALAYADNRVGEVSLDWDPEQLLADVNAGVDLEGLFREDELAELLAGLVDEPPKETPPAVDRAAELQTQYGTALGQIWTLGEHRLAVGDCTDKGVVEGVMGGGRAELFLTDPPYAVSYADKNKYLNSISPGNRIQVPIVNDHLTLDDASKIWLKAARNALEICQVIASYYWFACQGGDQMMMMMMMMIGEAGWKVRHELIWVKNNHVLGRSDYQYKHEPILYGWKKDGTHKFYGGFQTSVLEYAKPQSSDLHPTMKPVDLIDFLIGNSTERGAVVYDAFLGSGTTMIACENLNRKCRGIEIDPGYAAVSIHRWESNTGQQAELVAG